MNEEREKKLPPQESEAFLLGVDVIRGAISLSLEANKTENEEIIIPVAQEAKTRLSTFIDRCWPSIRTDSQSFIQTPELSDLEKILNSFLKPTLISDFSWAGEGASDYLKIIKKNRLKFWRQGYLQKLIEFFNLPEAILSLPPNFSDEAVAPLIGKSKEIRGLRFLPVYRLLEWEPKTDTLPVTVLVETNQGNQSDKLWLKEEDGRPFFLAATGGVLGLEELLIIGKEIGITLQVKDIVQQPDDFPKIKYVLFDLDGTLVSSAEEESKKEKDKRIALLKNLNSRGIKIGLWTRNYLGVAGAEVKRFSKESGVLISPVYCFGNWPFLDRDLRPMSRRNIAQIINVHGSDLGISEEEKVRFFSRVSTFFESNSLNPADYYFILEGKTPLLGALWDKALNSEQRKALFFQGVIVNNDSYNLLAALIFGGSFIYVNGIKNLPKVGNLI